jgi:hypothetical protein
MYACAQVRSGPPCQAAAASGGMIAIVVIVIVKNDYECAYVCITNLDIYANVHVHIKLM